MAGRKKKTTRLEMEKVKIEPKKGCVGCNFNDKGFCKYKGVWCSKVPKIDGFCDYRIEAPEFHDKKDPNVTVISGWLGYVKTNKHKPWDMPL